MYYSSSPKQIRIGPITTSQIEIRDIAKAWIVISLAFAIILNRDVFSFSFIYTFTLSGLTVGIGFLLHEMGHKIVAQRYGCFAEFRSFDSMLLLALAMSFTGFLFAAPGAVMIQGKVTNSRNGKISAAGPLVNIALALIFLIPILAGWTASGMLERILKYGFIVNSWLALFNMIPIWNFDGAKVFRWNKRYYLIIASFAVLLVAGKNYIM